MAAPEHKKRIRSANFTETEEDLLVRLVLIRKDVIECKASDTQRNEDKTNAWEEITTEFNANCTNTARSLAVLKKKYENIKKTIRQAASKERMARKATGGGRGPDEWRPKSEALAELREVISLSVDGLGSMYDDDHDYDQTVIAVTEDAIPEILNNAMTENSYVVEYLEEIGGILSTEEDNNITEQEVVGSKIANNSTLKSPSTPSPVPGPYAIAGPSRTIDSTQIEGRDKWENYSPAMLKRPISTILRTHTKRQKSAVELDLKKKLLERDEEMMEEIHRLEVQKRKVELESAHICLQTKKMKLQTQQLRYQHTRKEHTMRMKLLSNIHEKNTGKRISSSSSDSE